MAASPARAESEASDSAVGSQVRIAGRYVVDPNRPLAGFDRAGAKAYAVRDLRNAETALYALVHEPGIPCRQELIETLLHSPAANTLNPVLQDVGTPWPGQPERLITVMEAPQGPSLADRRAMLPINGQRLRRSIVPGLFKALSALHERQIYHRAIRPENVFFASESLDEVVLGDCVSAPPGADQPHACEPLERALADRFGRGAGGPEADMFALGATLLACHLGIDLASFGDGEKLFTSRVARGSFWALSRGTEIPGIVGALLRGLLNDDPAERWTLDEISAWLDSTAPSRRSVNTLWTFARPVTFRRDSYSDRRLLAREMARHPVEAARFLRELDFANWISNMVTTELFSERHERLLSVKPHQDLSGSRHGDHAMVARVCAHLDPIGPVRFRSLSLAIDGLGPALAEAYWSGDEQRLEHFRDLFSEGVLPTILEIMADRNDLVQRVVYPLHEAGKLVRTHGLAAGLPRVLYDLNPHLPCLSEQLRDRWVSQPATLLRALDDRAAAATEISRLFDAHVLAFFASRVQQAHRYVDRVQAGASDRVRLMTGVIDLVAFLQSTLEPGPLPNLTRQLANALRPILGELRSRRLRESAIKALERIAEKGDVTLLADNLQIGRLMQRDREGFESARGRLRQIANQRRRLERPVRARDPVALLPGLRLAAAAGWIVLLATTTAIILTR